MVGVFIMKQHTVVKQNGRRDNFNDDRVFKNTEKLTFKEILDHEETYNFDINKDGSVGDVVAEVIGYGINSQTTGIDKDGYSFFPFVIDFE